MLWELVLVPGSAIEGTVPRCLPEPLNYMQHISLIANVETMHTSYARSLSLCTF